MLKTLSLLIYADARIHATEFSNFLKAHPTIEDLEWEYLAPENLSPESLPYLRCLRGMDDTQAIVDILTADSPRKLQSLGQIPLNPQYLKALESIAGPNLRKLELRFFESLVSLHKLAEMFPRLTWLQVPSVDYVQAYKAVTKVRIELVRH